jgi:hypothetical protein
MNNILIKHIYLFIVALVALFISACSYSSDYNLDSQSFKADSIKLVESKTGLVLPKGTRGLNMFYRGSQIDPSFAAKVEIPSEAEPAMNLEITKITNQEINVSRPLFKTLSWWNISDSTILAERQYYGPNGYYVHIILCSENKKCILYVEWVSM